MNDSSRVGDNPSDDDIPASGDWDTAARIARLLHLVQQFAILDFSEGASVGDTGDDLDALAAGINMLGEELQGWNAEFQQRVAERTEQVTAASERLEAEIAQRRRTEEHLEQTNWASPTGTDTVRSGSTGQAMGSFPGVWSEHL